MLFKVESSYCHTKKMIKAENIGEIISSAKLKFNLPDNEYKISLQDGTDIDDDDILVEYATNYAALKNEPILIRILPVNTDVNHINLVNLGKENVTQNFVESEGICKSVIDLKSEVWGKIPKRLETACKNETVANHQDRRILVNLVGTYMLEELRDSSRPTCAKISDMICNTYPHTFLDTLAGKIVGNGKDTLTQEIYTVVNYKKASIKKRKLIYNEADSDDEENAKRKMAQDLSRRGDEYGCVEYDPQLPEHETTASQESKQKRLLQLFNTTERDMAEITVLMEETYPTQRALINERERNLELITVNWPFLKDPYFLLLHCNTLLGKTLKEVWMSSLQTNGKSLRQYSKNFYVRTSNKEMKEEFIKCNEACAHFRNKIPKTLLVFPLLALHFKESTDNLYKVINVDTEDDSVVKHVDSAYPVLLIQGHSIYDENAECFVVVEGNIIIIPRNALEGLLVTFAAYYIFGYTYLEKSTRTFEFLQRHIALINPAEGNKSGGPKKKQQSYSPAVYKLARNIEEYCSNFAV